MAKPRPAPGLAPGVTFSAAAAATVELCAREVFERSAGVLDTGEVERVHDMRVATRRLRAALEVFADCFPRKRHKRLLREVEQLADALGERRDPDVAIERLQDLADAFHAADRAGVEGLIAATRRRQRAGNQRLAAALAEARGGDLERRLLDLAREARR